MKGLEEQTDNRTKYLKVKHSSICEESKTECEGFKPIEVENPKTHDKITKYIKQYKGVEALIAGIEWYDTQERYETRYIGWRLHLNAAGVPCVLDLPFASRPAGRFMRLAENLDFTQPIEFSAWHDAKTDSTAFNVKQNGKSVSQLYTRDQPGDCPPPTQNFQGKWNFDAPNEFLHSRMMDVVIPAVEMAGNTMPEFEQAASAGADSTWTHPTTEISDDDIPF